MPNKPARTVRDMPAPYAVCDSCGQTPALLDPLPSGGEICPKCAVRALLYDAAAEHLRRLILPALGAWGNFWAAAGLPHKTLLELLETVGDGWMNPDAAERFRREVLATARRQFRAEPYAPRVPERLTATLSALPRVSRVLMPPSAGKVPPRLYFEQVSPGGKVCQYQPAPGLDLLRLMLPDGSAVLLPLGYGGELRPESLGDAVHVPADLLPAVLADWRSLEERAAEGEQ